MSARSFAAVALVLLAGGCKKPPVEAPGEMSDLAAFMFANFDNEDPAELEASIAKIEKLMDDHDLTGDLDDRAYQVTPLTKDDWGGIEGPAGMDPDEQLPMAVFGQSKHKLQPNIDLQAEKNHVCIESETTVYYARTFDSELDCFLSGECEFLRTSNEVRKESIAAKVWYDLYKDYRVVYDEENDRDVMFARGWIEEQFLADGGNNSWNELYSLEVWVPAGDKTKRFYSFWSAVKIGAIGDDLYQDTVKIGVDQGYLYADAFITDPDFDCGNDRDREYDRE